MSRKRRPIAPLETRYLLDDCRSFIREYPLATLVTHEQDAFHATATPLIFESDDLEEMRMVWHIARRNPQSPAIGAGQRALAVFSGPNAYLSPSWYKEKPEVPTWNYVSVQVRGVLTPLDDLDSNRLVLKRMAEFLERDQPQPWTLDGLLKERVDLLLPFIRSFRLDVDSIDGIARLSQEHPPMDQLRVVRQLIRRGKSDDLEIARLIAEGIDDDDYDDD